MSLFFIVVVFLFGLIIGSFLNCLIYRLENKRGFLKGRSFCPFCQHRLGWGDLIPILSFFLLRGRCRYCQQKISWQYPLVELFCGLLFALCFLLDLPYFLFFIISCLIVVFVYDLKHYLIPDKIIYPAIILTAVFNYANWPSAALTASFFLIIILVSRGKWMGVGDVKLGFLMGLLLGWPAVSVALFLAFMSGAIIGIGLIAKHKKTLKSEVPFGPFLVFGALVALFWGEIIINWYLGLL